MAIRLLLDTSIYGKIIEEKAEKQIMELSIIHKRDVLIYGIKLIRKELRDSPKHTKDRHSLRLALLNLYDNLTQNHEIEIKPLANNLAVLYYKEYRKNGGSVSWKSIKNDMIIVAEATISQLDIVASEDNKTMFSNPAKQSYYTINKKHNLITPNFIGYNEFKMKLL